MRTIGQCSVWDPGGDARAVYGFVESGTRVRTLGQCRVWDPGKDARAVYGYETRVETLGQ